MLYRLLSVVALALFMAASPVHADWFDSLREAVDQLEDSGDSATAAALSNSDITAGLKDALRVGSERVVKQLAKADGFNADPKIHIPLPDSLKDVDALMNGVGLGYMMDDLELKLNRAAEVATPKAKRIFGDAIRKMTIRDVQGIYKGPDDAATRYFKGKMSDPLSDEMRPVIEKALSQVGAVRAYDKVMGKYQALPFVPDVKADLSTHVVNGGLSGIFHYMAVEEAAIRKNPAKRTTEILRKVFGH
ncbi:MAG: DUF4197 family protein [Mariprofundaceae bacterium]|nr:DUF4197 family protein [Mariprofundaceae bacterium]